MRASFYFLIVIIISLAGILMTAPESAYAATNANIIASPTQLYIPSIGINATIQAVGVNAKGEMAVPSGKSKAVGWYKYGTTPGQIGSAVIDAHVFAAFSRLKDLKPGADVYVVTATKQVLHFVVAANKTFALSALSPQQLFRPTASPDLNLITCAGSLSANGSTYDHRLIVYATLVG